MATLVNDSNIGLYLDKENNFLVATDAPNKDVQALKGVAGFTVHAAVDSVVSAVVHAYPTRIHLSVLPENTTFIFDNKIVSKKIMLVIQELIKNQEEWK